MTWTFRLRVTIAPGRGIKLPEGYENPFTLLRRDDVSLELRMHEPQTAYRPTDLALIGRGFASDEEARRAGEFAKSAIRVAGVMANVPIDVGRDEQTSGPSEYLKNRAQDELGVRLRGDVHGLDVFEDDGMPDFTLSASAAAVGLAPLDRFADALRYAFERRSVLDGDLTLAIDLYFSARFEASSGAKFLLLITVLEVLAERSERPALVLEHLEHLIRTTVDVAQGMQGADRESIDSLITALRGLRLESISASIRQLVRKTIPEGTSYADQKADRFATACYGLRSGLIHPGQPDSRELAAERLPELQKLVQAVLRHLLGDDSPYRVEPA